MMRLSTYVHDGQYVTEFQGFAIPKRFIIFCSNLGIVLWSIQSRSEQKLLEHFVKEIHR